MADTRQKTGAKQKPSGAAPTVLPDDTMPVGEPKRILLFSDGTGNSSSSLQKTNVWRLYEAVDLGYPTVASSDPKAKDTKVQIAYYDDGVGTSSFKFLAILGGVFGFGLARNIRDIYKFLCRNYVAEVRDENGKIIRDADTIHVFGFSRGAYTIRLLVALVVASGIAPCKSERELDLAARDLWREYRRGFHTNMRSTDLLVTMGRAFVRTFIRAKRKLLREPAYPHGLHPDRQRPSAFQEWRNYWKSERGDPSKLCEVGPDIEFVGVWDTVAAYGGPMVEITRAIDLWIWPLSMPDYRLSPKVKRARHALAIDDKRDAFQPVLWDEVEEADHEDTARLQQVWFAGMHADVGGGYSDDSLAYVSLTWMIEHAEATGVRLLADARKKIVDYRNICGPVHDSRGGAGAFYRYQPRYIGAWIDYPFDPKYGGHVRPATQLYRDPTIDRGRYKDRGLLVEPIRLHKSVIQRLTLATDGYAPINLPLHYREDDGLRGSTISGADFDRKDVRPLLLAMGDNIKWRRIFYFLAMLSCVALAIKPLWPGLPFFSSVSGVVDARTDIFPLEAMINAILPEFLHGWTHSVTEDLFASLGVVFLIFLFTALGVSREKAMVDLSRSLWKARLEGQPVSYNPGWEQRIRWLHKSGTVQGTLAGIKWKLLPFLVGLLMWFGIAYAVVAAGTQFLLAAKETDKDLCVLNGDAKPVPALQESDSPTKLIDTNNPCADTGLLVKAGQTYTIRVAILDQSGKQPLTRWCDDTVPATPAGWKFNEPACEKGAPKPKGTEAVWGERVARHTMNGLSRFFRRVVSAPLMAPVVEIMPNRPDPSWFRRLSDGKHMIQPDFVDRGNGVWEATFTTPERLNGIYDKSQQARVAVFLNDAVLPVWDAWGTNFEPKCAAIPYLINMCGRYENNHGQYRVTMISGAASSENKCTKSCEEKAQEPK